MQTKAIAQHTRQQEQPKHTKKEQIMGLYGAGIQNVGELASLTQTRPSYVASVLQKHEILPEYFDLYTTSKQPMNIYSKLFVDRLGFRTVGIAKRSVSYINRIYQYFESIRDRAGQHHTLVMALIMLNRARWSEKLEEAKIFEAWLQKHIAVS